MLRYINSFFAIKVNNVLSNLLFILLYICILNAPVFILLTQFPIFKPLVDGHLFFVILISIYSFWIASLVYILYVIYHVLYSIAFTFHFGNAFNIIFHIPDAKYLNILGLFDWNIIVLLLLLLFAIASIWLFNKWLLNKKKSHHFLLIISSLLIIIILDIVNGTMPRLGFGLDKNYITDFNIFGFSAYPEFTSIFDVTSTSIAVSSSIPVTLGSISYRYANKWIAKGDKSVVIIIVESMGLPKYKEIEQYYLQKFKLSDRQVDSYSEKYSGTTTDAELRVLTDFKINPLQIKSEINSSLPHKASHNGFNVIGYHGFTSSLFSRYIWWKYLGLKQMKFLSDYDKFVPRHHGVFNGICDSYLIHEVFYGLNAGKQFKYLLTLDTHFPITGNFIDHDILPIRKNMAYLIT
jgi:hypothetical protein